uniref:Uncharacterized protein n=1 Tax=Setaria italica TaxID=4555 RepID=K3Z257_SETIT
MPHLQSIPFKPTSSNLDSTSIQTQPLATICWHAY